MSGSGISWAICKAAPSSRQITMPAPHHSFFYRTGALPAAQPTASRHWRPVVVIITIICLGLPRWTSIRRNIHTHTHEEEEKGFARATRSIEWYAHWNSQKSSFWITYMFTEWTEPVSFRNDHDWWTQTRTVVPSIAPITQQYLHEHNDFKILPPFYCPFSTLSLVFFLYLFWDRTLDG